MANRTIGSGGYVKARRGVRKMHVRKGDRVRVIRGDDVGKEGAVLEAIPRDNRVVVEGVNMRKRHTRPSNANPDGGIITFEAPIAASNVMLLDPDGEPTRTRKRLESDGRKERISVRTGNPIPEPGA
jgi:large subunit ribosomal protein L24